MEKQSGPSYCVPNSMAYLSKSFGGSTSQNVFTTRYVKSYAKTMYEVADFWQNGVHSSNFSNCTQSNFNTSPFKNFQNAIDSGKPILSIMNQTTNDAHSVVIIGYYPNGNLMFYNPYTGGLNNSPFQNFNSLFSIPIDGQK